MSDLATGSRLQWVGLVDLLVSNLLHHHLVRPHHFRRPPRWRLRVQRPPASHVEGARDGSSQSQLSVTTPAAQVTLFYISKESPRDHLYVDCHCVHVHLRRCSPPSCRRGPQLPSRCLGDD
eukprot:UN15905